VKNEKQDRRELCKDATVSLKVRNWIDDVGWMCIGYAKSKGEVAGILEITFG